MTERAITMNALKVRAIMSGRKTQERLIVKPQPHVEYLDLGDGPGLPMLAFKKRMSTGGWLYPNALKNILAHCPLGKPGSHLWVKEAWRFINMSSESNTVCIGYEADGPDLPNRPDIQVSPEWIERLWSYRDIWSHRKRSSMHMPRWASRITLEITEVRVERLQEISEEDAKAEGAEPIWAQGPMLDEEAYIRGFTTLWQHINGAGSWAANPFCWAISFRVIQPEARP